MKDKGTKNTKNKPFLSSFGILKGSFLRGAVLLLIILTLICCGKPSDDTARVSFFEWVKQIIDKVNQTSGSNDALKNLINDELSNLNFVLRYDKDATLNITSKEDKKSDLFYTLDNNKFITKQSFYITFIKNDTYISFDAKNWLIFKLNDKKQHEREYFYGDYHIDSDYSQTNKTLNIIYTLSFRLKDRKILRYEPLNTPREIIQLSPRMIFNDINKANITTDLTKVILFIPKDTVFSGKINLDGNIFKANCEANNIRISSLTNIFLYIKNKMLSVSFDDKNWNISILSLKMKQPSIHIESLSDREIFFNMELDISIKDK